MVQACANCHGPDGSGLAGFCPYLAGQHAAYLAATLAAWRDGTRHNDPSAQMPTIAKSLADTDLQAVAAYYAGLPAGRWCWARPSATLRRCRRAWWRASWPSAR